jgi:hypothetical protein
LQLENLGAVQKLAKTLDYLNEKIGELERCSFQVSIEYSINQPHARALIGNLEVDVNNLLRIMESQRDEILAELRVLGVEP